MSTVEAAGEVVRLYRGGAEVPPQIMSYDFMVALEQLAREYEGTPPVERVAGDTWPSDDLSAMLRKRAAGNVIDRERQKHDPLLPRCRMPDGKWCLMEKGHPGAHVPLPFSDWASEHVYQSAAQAARRSHPMTPPEQVDWPKTHSDEFWAYMVEVHRAHPMWFKGPDSCPSLECKALMGWYEKLEERVVR